MFIMKTTSFERALVAGLNPSTVIMNCAQITDVINAEGRSYIW